MIFNNIYYKLTVILGSILGGLYKIHQIWMAEASVEGILKVVGIIIILAILFTPSDLLQSEDR